MKTKLCCFFFVVILMVFTNEAYASYNSDEVLICNTCTKSQDFKNAAISAGNGSKIVLNINTATAKRYITIIEPVFNVKTAFEEPLTSNDISQLDEIKTLNKKVELYLSRLDIIDVVGAANGCGGEGQNVPDFIRNGMLKNACDAHDICYDRGESQNICDLMLEVNINEIRDRKYQEYINQGKPLRAKFVYVSLTKIAKKAREKVEEQGAEYYCNIDINKDSLECLLYLNDLEGIQQALFKNFLESANINTKSLTVFSNSGRRLVLKCTDIVAFTGSGDNLARQTVQDCRLVPE